MIEGLAFSLGMLVSALIALAFIRWMVGPVPIRPPFAGPRYIFRLVKRDERAVYVRIQRRTYAVAMRDLGRAANRAARQIGKALLPVMRRLSDAMSEALGKR